MTRVGHEGEEAARAAGMPSTSTPASGPQAASTSTAGTRAGGRMRYVVGTVDEIPPGGRKLIEIDGRSIGVFNIDGEYFALRNRCPHQGGPLCKGRQAGVLVSPLPGEFELTRPGEILRCPWHGWEFDVRTGQSWFDPRGVRVRRYDVSVEPVATLSPEAGGAAASGTEPTGADATTPPPAVPGTAPSDVSAATCGGQPEPDMGGLAKGPYVAETYPVSVEQQYVVVELGGPRSASRSAVSAADAVE